MEITQAIVAIVGIVCGLGFVGYLFGKIIGLIKSWINRNNSSIEGEKFDRLAKAFIKHKKDSERRFQNLETIVTDEQPESASSSGKSLHESSHETIEIDSPAPDQEQAEKESGRLNNMLHKQEDKS